MDDIKCTITTRRFPTCVVAFLIVGTTEIAGSIDQLAGRGGLRLGLVGMVIGTLALGWACYVWWHTRLPLGASRLAGLWTPVATREGDFETAAPSEVAPDEIVPDLAPSSAGKPRPALWGATRSGVRALGAVSPSPGPSRWRPGCSGPERLGLRYGSWERARTGQVDLGLAALVRAGRG